MHNTFPHLVDHRSFSSWSPHFHQFAQAFTDYGLPIQNLIGFIDGKLWAVCRPGRYQNVHSGHKRIHGIKTQGIIFPNGVTSTSLSGQFIPQNTRHVDDQCAQACSPTPSAR